MLSLGGPTCKKTKTFANRINRISEVMEDIIQESQTACIPGSLEMIRPFLKMMSHKEGEGKWHLVTGGGGGG